MVFIQLLAFLLLLDCQPPLSVAIPFDQVMNLFPPRECGQVLASGVDANPIFGQRPSLGNPKAIRLKPITKPDGTIKPATMQLCVETQMVLELMPTYDDELFTPENLHAENTSVLPGGDNYDPNGPLQMDHKNDIMVRLNTHTDAHYANHVDLLRAEELTHPVNNLTCPVTKSKTWVNAGNKRPGELVTHLQTKYGYPGPATIPYSVEATPPESSLGNDIGQFMNVTGRYRNVPTLISNIASLPAKRYIIITHTKISRVKSNRCHKVYWDIAAKIFQTEIDHTWR